MPLAWVDEIAGLEPAINFLKGNGYTSKLWPHQGVEKQFLAYLPLQGWLHILTQSILDFSVYSVRLPYAVFLLIGAFFLYRALKLSQVELLTSLIILVLVLNEKSLFETTRAVRVEPITFMLLSICYFGLASGKKYTVAIASSFMLVLHPYVWPAAGILLLTTFYTQNSEVKHKLSRFFKPTLLWLAPIAVGLIFLAFIRFDVDLFYSQFTDQAGRHSSFGGIGTRFYNHFIQRFWPYYITQPYIPILIYFTLGYAAYRLAKGIYTPAAIALVATHIIWFIVLGPMHRYNSVLIILSLFAIVPLLSKLRLKHQTISRTIVVFLILAISSIDVASRQVMATAQRVERSPDHILDWLNANISSDSSIISGSEIAYYAAIPRDNLDFFLFNTTPYRFDFEKYKNHYLLSYKQRPNHTIIAKYKIPTRNDWSWIKRSGTHTYHGLYLLRANDLTDYEEALRIMKSENTAERSKHTYK